MNISEDTLKVLEFLDNYSEGGIRKRNDIALLLEIAASNNQHELFNNLVFTGKSVWNLSKKVKKIDPHQEGADLVRNEFARQLDGFKKILEILLNQSDDEKIAERFDTIYFVITQGAVKNIIDLSHDLAIFKDVQSQSKKMWK